MDDREFHDVLKEILADARSKNLDEAKRALFNESGDEFGDVALGDWRDIQAIASKPIGDVLSTGWGNILKVGGKARQLIDTLKAGIKASVIPFVAGDFDKIYQRDEQRQRAIETKYGNITDRARALMKDDAMLGAFLLNPAMMLSAVAGHAASDKVLELAKVMLGDNRQATNSIDKLMRSMFGEGRLARSLLEASIEDKRRVQSLIDDLSEEIKGSSVVREIQQAEQNRYNAHLNDLIDRAEEVAGVTKLEDLERLYGKRLVRHDLIQDLGDEAKAASDVILDKSKATHLQAIMSGLQAKVDYLKNMNVPEAASIITAHENAIGRIKQQLPKGVAAESVMFEDTDYVGNQVALSAFIAAETIYDALDDAGWAQPSLNLHQVQQFGDWLGPTGGGTERSYSDALEHAGSHETLVKRLFDGIRNVMLELALHDVALKDERVIKDAYRDIVRAMKWFVERGAERPTSGVQDLLKRKRRQLQHVARQDTLPRSDPLSRRSPTKSERPPPK